LDRATQERNRGAVICCFAMLWYMAYVISVNYGCRRRLSKVGNGRVFSLSRQMSQKTGVRLASGLPPVDVLFSTRLDMQDATHSKCSTSKAWETLDTLNIYTRRSGCSKSLDVLDTFFPLTTLETLLNALDAS
jgi:hypothetical protein